MAGDEGLGVFRQPSVLSVREPPAHLRQPSKVRRLSLSARASALRIPLHVPPVPTQRHERSADEVANARERHDEEQAWTPHATMTIRAKISHGPPAASPDPLLTLNRMIDASAPTTPTVASPRMRSRRMITTISTVMDGEIEMQVPRRAEYAVEARPPRGARGHWLTEWRTSPLSSACGPDCHVSLGR